MKKKKCCANYCAPCNYCPMHGEETMDKEQRKLEFFNPTFHDGVNVTVRHGMKWSDAGGEMVELVDTQTGDLVGMAVVEGTYVSAIGDIPDQFLKLEHDKYCRKLAGLWKVMEKTYNRTFSFFDRVTVLFFRKM